MTTKRLLEEQKQVLVSKVRICDWYSQTAFAGGGLAFAETLLKDTSEFNIDEPSSPTADFTGLECRWKRVNQENKTVLTVLIKAQTNQLSELNIYRDIIDTTNSFITSEHPIDSSALSFSWNPDWLKNEFKPRTFSHSFWGKIMYLSNLYYRILLGKVLMRFNIKIGTFNWGNYKSNLVASSDYKKFDDMLRFVISCTTKEKEALLSYLERLENENRIIFGVHESEAALVTCIIKQYSGFHFHFIDGDNGGYALAATQLSEKQKLMN